MQPRLWVGYYGLDKFVNMRLYQEVRNDYWKLYPQRPFSTEEPSTWLREGSDAVNVRGTVRELEENLRQHRFDMEMLCLGTVGFGIGGPSFQQDLGVQPPRSWRDLVHSLDTEAMHRLSLEERAPAE
jgi:hypothetical protein